MKKKLLFVNDEMTMGGVARILNNLLLKLDPQKYDIDVLILHPHGELLKDLPTHVRLLESRPFFEGVDVSLGSAFKQFNLIQIYRKLSLVIAMKTGFIETKIISERKKMNLGQYDVEFSAKEGFCTIFVANGNAHRKLNWVQVDYHQQNYSKNHMPLMIKSLKSIDMNIACSKPVEKAYQDIFEVTKISVIHNLVDDLKIKSLVIEPIQNPFKAESIKLITVARFHPQKSLDRLLKAYASVKQTIGNLELVIIGDGELRESLINLSKSLNIEDSVQFLGIINNPYPYIHLADLFVMSSLYEGYPTIVIESLLAGTPVLTTSVAGVDEQIEEGIHGWIVDNTTEALTQKLLEVCQNLKGLKAVKQKLSGYQYPNVEILHALEEELSQS